MKTVLLVVAAMVFAAPFACAYPPYHDISDIPGAQAEANERGLPIAFLGVIPGVWDNPTPAYNSDAELAKMALNDLQNRAVVITLNGLTMAGVPNMVHAQFHIGDDGPLQGGAAWLMPKVVLTDPGITKILGRVSHTQMAAGRESPLDALLDSIRNDRTALLPAPKVIHPGPIAGADEQVAAPPAPPEFGTPLWVFALVVSRWQIFTAAAGIFIVALIAWAAKNL